MRPTASTRLLLLLAPVLLSALVTPTTAEAQSDDERGRFHFQAGRSYFEQGRYEDAVREWQESYQLSGRHTLLRNIAEAQERVFQFREAIASLRQYLEVGGEEAEASRQTLVSRIERLERLAAEYASRAGGSSAAPGVAQEDAPAPDPGSGEEDDGATVVPPEDGGAERPGPVPPVGGGVERAGWTWAWVGLGLTGALAVGATVAGSLALVRYNGMVADCNRDTQVCTSAEWTGEQRQRVERAALAADILIGLAGAAAVATVLLFVLEPRPERPARASVAPWVAAGGGGLAAALSF